MHIPAKNPLKPLYLNGWDLEIHVVIAWRDGYAGTASARTIWSTSEQNYSNALYVYCVETPWALSFSRRQKSVCVAVKHMMEGFVNTQAGFTKYSQILILGFRILSLSQIDLQPTLIHKLQKSSLHCQLFYYELDTIMLKLCWGHIFGSSKICCKTVMTYNQKSPFLWRRTVQLVGACQFSGCFEWSPVIACLDL